MIGTEIEKAFNRALLRSFSLQKALLMFPTLLVCGILIVFCAALRLGVGGWVGVSLIFLPILLCSLALLAVGVLTLRMDCCEAVSLVELGLSSLKSIVRASYFPLFSLAVYFLIWVALGIFFLLKEIPWVGVLFQTLLAFAPFLLLLGLIVLCIGNVLFLFFAVPVLAAGEKKAVFLGKDIIVSLRENPFANSVLFLMSLAPCAVVLKLLLWAASMTNLGVLQVDQSWALALQWLFLMVPIAAVLTPAVLFFFHFAAEASRLRAPS